MMRDQHPESFEFKTYYIETYGCTFNQSDSEKIESRLNAIGLEKKTLEIADILIINTCAVKQTTESKLIDHIKQLHKKFMDKPIIITGCLPYIDIKIKNKLALILGSNGGFIHPHEIAIFEQKLKNILAGNIVLENMESLQNIHERNCLITMKGSIQPKILPNQLSGIIQISEGCIYNCAYCCTKNARGNLVSFDNKAIIAQVKNYISNGVKEIYLTGQDLGVYNYNNIKLHHLLKEISSISGNFYVRLGMLNPTYILSNLRELLEIFQDLRFFRFLHIPIQSASNDVLIQMRRPYKIELLEKKIEEIKQFDTKFTFSTDIITGFPGETDEDHHKTIDFLDRWRPEILNLSKYSNRPNTIAKNMHQLPSEIVKERSLQLTAFFKKYNKEQNQKWVGWSGKMLINETTNSNPYPLMGRNQYYKSILINKGSLGQEINVMITGFLNYSLIGQKV